MLSHLLDTSVYSQRLRPRPDPRVVDRWKKLGDGAMAISAICEAELLYGLEKRGSTRLWQEFRAYLENWLIILPVDKPVCEQFGQLKARQERLGCVRADFDLLIAATALAHDLTLATLNVAHFQDLPGLRVEDWGMG